MIDVLTSSISSRFPEASEKLAHCADRPLPMETRSAGLSIGDYEGMVLESYDLGGVDCPYCGNSGTVTRIGEDGALYSRSCRCMKKRIALRRIRRSGMSDLIRRYRFENWQADTPEQKKILQLAHRFAAEDSGWFYIFGQSGAGKSHICTAICGTLIERNRDVYYMPWRDESTLLKSLVTDAAAYLTKIKPLKQAEVLYIDDFLKGGDTDADIRLAYEILNYRYNDKALRTIVSSEMPLETLLRRDEALGGRIYERARGFVLQAPTTNRRFEG